ncbi:MAG: hypothetical protein PG977_000471 [Bartonella clarridgeiae]|nr:MAG: hypothetical protein PG977_000471 [Bartonella clarridgeiae]
MLLAPVIYAISYTITKFKNFSFANALSQLSCEFLSFNKQRT